MTVDVEHADTESNIGRHFDHDGTIWLDGNVAENFSHALCLADTKGRVVEVQQIIIRLRNRFDDAQESCRTLIG